MNIDSRVVHLVHLKNDMQHNIRRIKFIKHKIYKRIPNNEGFIKSKVDRFKMWAIPLL